MLLDAGHIGGQVYVTRDSVRDFTSARSADGARIPQAPAPSTRSRRAMQELERLGT
jgi:hypothetical protein